MESENLENEGLGERGPEDIEREIAGTRSALESTMSELGERLRPGQIAQDAGAYVRETASRGAHDAWESLRVRVRDNPVPVAVVLGGGLVWYLMSRRENGGAGRYAGHGLEWADGLLKRGGVEAAGGFERAAELGRHFASRASEVGAQTAARAGELGTQLAGRASDLGGQAAERASEVGHRVREAGAELGARVQGRAGFGRRDLASLVDGASVVRVLEQRPLLAGAAGFALGALVFGAFRRRAEGGRSNGGARSAHPAGPETPGAPRS
jgi:hypothetical protein